MPSKVQRTYFVTGFPGFIGRKLVAHLAEQRPEVAVYLLVQPAEYERARSLVRALPRPVRFEVLQGDVVDMHLGLSGAEYARLCDEVTDVFHLAAVSHPGVPREVARRVNVEGTRNVLELGRDCRRLRRLSHFSTAFVSGTRTGVVAEDELDQGQGFRDELEQTKLQAEKLVTRARRELPAVIFRPPVVVGDSITGDIDRLDGPFYLGVLRVAGPLPVPLPLPGEGAAPLHIAPVDFVVEAAFALSELERSTGRTFHLVDPSPMSARRIFEMVARQVQRKLPRASVPARAAEAVLRMPLLERLTRPQRSALEHLNHLVFYNCQNTLELLGPSGLRCPPVPSYLPRLVEAVRERHRRGRGEASSVVDDPLDIPQRGGATAS